MNDGTIAWDEWFEKCDFGVGTLLVGCRSWNSKLPRTRAQETGTKASIRPTALERPTTVTWTMQELLLFLGIQETVERR